MPKTPVARSNHPRYRARQCPASNRTTAARPPAPVPSPVLLSGGAGGLRGWQACVLREAGQKGPTSLSLFSRDLNLLQKTARLDQTPAEEDVYVRPAHCSTHQNPDIASIGGIGGLGRDHGQPSSQPFTWLSQTPTVVSHGFARLSTFGQTH